jgi:hypothetical protein
MDDKAHDVLISEATTRLGEMHRSILKSAHSMDAERWVNVKHGSFTRKEWTELGKQVGMDEIHWWITEKEPDVDELLAHTKEALEAAQVLKKASEKLRDGEPESYENLLVVLKDFAEEHKAEINVLAGYVSWLEQRDGMAPRILFTYRVWGSTRMSDREMDLDGAREPGKELQALIEIVLGVRSRGLRAYEWQHMEVGLEVCESMDPEQVAMNAEVVVPEARVVRRTARVVFENCATYFAEIRDSLRNIVLDIEKFKAQRELLQSDAFWQEFIRKAAGAKTSEPQLWDFKETLNVWRVKGDLERRKAKVTLAEDVASFANSSGGVLIVGVNDRREIVGIGDGREIENRLKVARDVIAEYIEYDREIISFRQVVMKEEGQDRICLAIVISQACLPVGVSDGQDRYSYPARRETGITRVSRDRVPVSGLHLKSDNQNFLEELWRFTKEID